MLGASFPRGVGCLLLAVAVTSEAWARDEAVSTERTLPAATTSSEHPGGSEAEIERDPPIEGVLEDYDRMEGLSKRGSKKATIWCLRHFDAARGVTDLTAPLSPEDRTAKLVLYGRLASAPGFEDLPGLFSQLAEEAARLGRRDVVLLIESIARTSRADEVKAAALFWEASLTAGSTTTDVRSRERAIALYDELLSRYPRDGHASLAEDARWRLEHLAIGAVAPDFVTYDVYGNEIRLSDFVGNVSVVRFWSGEDRGSERLRLAERTIVKHLWDERFVLIGINSDPVRADYLRVCDEFQVTWTTSAWEGGASKPARQAWRSTGTPETFVLDAHGVIRYVGLEGLALETAVRELLGEVRSRLYATSKPNLDDEG